MTLSAGQRGTMVAIAGAAAHPAEWPVIDLRTAASLVVGRSRSCNVQIENSMVSGEHARFTRLVNGVEVTDCNSRYGTAVNGVRVARALLRLGDLVELGGAVLYRFDGQRLLPEGGQPGLGITFRDVSFVRGERRLLSGVNARLRAGTFVALLGPSGAGKSLFLGCLATTLEPSGGELLVNDRKAPGGTVALPQVLEEYRSRLGIVGQDDVLFMSLTARENLHFAAMLRVPASQPGGAGSAEIQQLVDTALTDVGMAEHADKQVSVLSGGQRKRVSVAIELLRRPRLLLLDEPTSGLDPGMQAKVMDMLRRLSRQGITVVASTHTMDTLHFFDEAIILAPVNGSTTVVYQGPPAEAFEQFAVRDAADLFDKLSAMPTDGKLVRASGDRVASQKMGVTASTISEPEPLPLAPELVGRNRPTVAPIQSFAAQAKVVSRRSLLGLARDRSALVLTIAQPLILAVLIAASQGRQDRATAFHFFIVVSAVWVGMTIAVREIVRERSNYLRDRLAGLRPLAYLAGKTAFVVGVATAQSIVLFTLARWLTTVFPTTETAADELLKTSIAGSVFGTLSAGIAGAMIGLTLSTVARTEQAAVALLPLVLLPMILFSRVATGDTNASWSDKESPFLPIADVKEAVRHKDFNTQKASLIAVSSILVTRPATAAIDTLRDQGVVDRGANLVEWLHLSALMAGHATLLASAFVWCDRRWKSVR